MDDKSKEDSLTLIVSFLNLFNKCQVRTVNIAGALGSILVLGILRTMPISFLGFFLMAINFQQDTTAINYSLYVGISGFVGCLATMLSYFFLSMVIESLVLKIRKNIFIGILNAGNDTLNVKESNVGTSCFKLCNQPRFLQTALHLPLLKVLESLVSVIVYVTICLYLDWKQGLIVLIHVSIFLGFICFQQKVIREENKQCERVLCESTKLALEASRNIRTVASLNAEEKIHAMYERELLSNTSTLKKTNNIIATVYSLNWALSIPGFFLNVYCGNLFVTNNLSLVESFASICLIHIFVIETIRSLSLTFIPVQKALASSKGVVETLEELEENAQKQIYQDLSIGKGNIHYNNVRFVYPSLTKTEILKDINLSVDVGKTIALLGHSGSGKTTIISLLLRIFEPTSGSIYYADKNIASFPVDEWRKNIGIVFEKPYLFNRTIAENIAYGANYLSVTQEDIIKAAKLANIHNFITCLPQGYDTKVGTRGIQFSGGQKQRIALARALIRNPKILILDEATTSLDKQSEMILQEALDDVRRERTCIITAHSLTTVQDADVIYILNKGKLQKYQTNTKLTKKNN